MRDAASEHRDDRIFFALADATRRRILELLASGERSVHAIAAVFPVSRPAISKHLKVLREAGLVGERTVGRTRVHFRSTAYAAEILTRYGQELASSAGRHRPAARVSAVTDRASPSPVVAEATDEQQAAGTAERADREPTRSRFEPWLGR